jgi:hypothetical protein
MELTSATFFKVVENDVAVASVGIPNPFFKVGTYYYNWSTIGLRWYIKGLLNPERGPERIEYEVVFAYRV